MKIIRHFFSTASQYIYTIYVMLVFLLTFLVVMPLFLVFTLFKTKTSTRLYLYLFKSWVRIFFFLIGFAVRIYGKENADKNGKYVVVANHYSYLDTPMIFRALPFFVRPLASASYSKIPVFGYLYRKVAVMVDRSSIMSKHESFKKMMETIQKEDTNVFVFPEGSFNETDDILQPFYDGAFRIAKETNTAILPMIFPDTIKRWHYSSFWKWTPGICRAYILPPIPVEKVQSMSAKEMKDYVYQEMLVQMSIIDN